MQMQYEKCLEKIFVLKAQKEPSLLANDKHGKFSASPVHLHESYALSF